MNKKVFRSTVAVAMTVLLLSLGVVFAVLFRIFEQRLTEELKRELSYIASGVELNGDAYLREVSDGRRITLVASDGRVTYDSRGDAADLENHLSREEVAEALELGVGVSVRYSGTFPGKTVYCAKKLSDGSVLRIASEQSTVVTLLFELIKPFLAVVALAVLLSFVLSSRTSKSIISPINSIDPDSPETAQVYEELSPLLSKISAQNKTIRRQLDEAGRLRHEFGLITDNMSEGFLVLDGYGTVLTHNSAALRLLSAEDSGVDSFVGAGYMKLNRSSSFREAVKTALGGERAEKTAEIGGSTYELIANPTRGQGGDVIGAVIVILDVTESADREKLRREFTSNVSHELKTPLTSISGFAEVMAAGGVPENVMVKFSRSIYSEAQRLISLVSDIIRVSRLDEVGTDIQMEDVDLAELNREICHRLAPKAEKAGVTLECYGICDPVRGNRQILDDMISNLCDNGIKYNVPGGSVRVVLSSVDGRTALSVADTGIGIPVDQQSRVFERFFRVDKSHSKSVEGTGLGLSIVKHAAAFHGASVSLESTLGEGTRVTVTF